MDENPRPSKRARKSCERCRTRKQKCHGFPVCANCANAKEECVQPPSAIEEYNRYDSLRSVKQRLTVEVAPIKHYLNGYPFLKACLRPTRMPLHQKS